MNWLIRDVGLLDGDVSTDVRLRGSRVHEIGIHLPRQGEEVIDGRGGLLLPGLHDHHIHLHATAAWKASVDCSLGLRPLRASTSHRIRGVASAESVDRHALDAIVRDRPVRVQHRTGALWMLNSAALDELAPLPVIPGIERDELGLPTGRLWRSDSLLRGTWPPVGDTAQLGRDLARHGITGATDATPGLDEKPDGMPQQITLLGERKVVVSDHALPGLDDLRDRFADLHRRLLAVAVHCVTLESLLLTLAALDDVGRLAGDRIEHAAVVPHSTARRLRGLAVVTQPAFITAHGERYRTEVASEDLPHLYPFRRLLDAGVDVVASSDAPYGPLDPWEVIRAAAHRDLTPEERVPVRVALEGYLRDSSLRPRQVRAGARADLVLLAASRPEVLDAPDTSMVRYVWIGGILT